MQQREKLLAIALGGVLVLIVVWTFLKPWYLGPIELEEAQLAQVQADLDRLTEQQLQYLAAARNLATWKSESLPPDAKPKGRARPDATIGQQRYQEWLIDLARHCGFRNPDVTPSTTRAVQDVYISVPVRLSGQATYRQLCQFLALFEQTDLLHRIESCQIVSSDYRGDPLLEINLVAEGVAILNAPQRTILFPTTQLASSIDAGAGKLNVKTANGFPQSGRFRIELGGEQLMVGQAKGEAWQVTRGTSDTKAIAHAAGVAVDLGLYNPLSKEGGASEPHPRLTALSAENPFVIPPPKIDYRPALVAPETQTAYLGSLLEFEVRAENFNPTQGQPTFQLMDPVPEGLQLSPSRENAMRAAISWRPENETDIGMHTISIQVSQDGMAQPLKKSVAIRISPRNFAPEIEEVKQQIVYSGQTLKFDVRAKDANSSQRLSYSLDENAPLEAMLDSATGKFSWTPPGPVTEQTLELKIIVSDDGSPAEKSSITVPIEIRPDVAHFTKYVGSLILDAQIKEALLFDRWNKRDLVVKEGQTLEVADISAKVVAIEQNQLTFERDGAQWTLKSGQDLREMVPAASDDTAQNRSR